MRKALGRHGSPAAITTGGLRSYGAMDELGCGDRQETGRWAKERVEDSHLSFRQRARAMLRFRQMKTLQTFASVHANVHNHFSLSVASSIDRPTANDAAPHWPSGRCSPARLSLRDPGASYQIAVRVRLTEAFGSIALSLFKRDENVVGTRIGLGRLGFSSGCESGGRLSERLPDSISTTAPVGTSRPHEDGRAQQLAAPLSQNHSTPA